MFITKTLTPSGQRLLSLLFSLPWLNILAEIYRVGRKLWQGMADEGMYEVLEYESTVELHDTAGKVATYRKRQRIRYLQNHIIAFQDQIWSDGVSPIDYQCSPGVVVDRYRPAQTTILLISLCGVRMKGDVNVFESRCRIHNGFVRDDELWQTSINHRMHVATIHIVFPQERPPQKVWGTEELTKRRHSLASSTKRQLPDGRWRITWQIRKPRLNERYNLHWRW